MASPPTEQYEGDEDEALCFFFQAEAFPGYPGAVPGYLVALRGYPGAPGRSWARGGVNVTAPRGSTKKLKNRGLETIFIGESWKKLQREAFGLEICMIF